jgi:glycosyltransferase involved in cell wall biosynthesis
VKVLVWSQYFWPENFLINDLTVDLYNQGVDVTVVTGKPNYPDGQVFPGYTTNGIQREDYFGVKIFRVPLHPRGNGSPKRLLLNYLSFILSGYFFAPFVLRGRKFDAVLVYAPSPLLQALPAIFVAWLKNAPLIVWVQDLWPEALLATGYLKNRWLLRLVELVVRYIYRHSDSILIQSEAFRTPVSRLVGDVGKINYYPNSAKDIRQFMAWSENRHHTIAEMREKFSVVFAGNIGSAQACETIVSAADLLRDNPEIAIYLVGSGSAAKSIAQDIKIRGLDNIFMTGRLPVEVMPSVYSAASVLLVSLKNDPALSATVPSKLQSYFSAGRPIIASLNGEACRLILEANAGLSCPAEDAEALALAIQTLYDMKADDRLQVGANARVYFKANFSAPELLTWLVDHLQIVINNHRLSPDVDR